MKNILSSVSGTVIKSVCSNKWEKIAYISAMYEAKEITDKQVILLLKWIEYK